MSAAGSLFDSVARTKLPPRLSFGKINGCIDVLEGKICTSRFTPRKPGFDTFRVYTPDGIDWKFVIRSLLALNSFWSVFRALLDLKSTTVT